MAEMVETAALGGHIGRLVAFHRGRWYELLGVGEVDEDGFEVTVTVPAPRHNLLGQPNAAGTTVQMKVLVDEYPVKDCPTDPVLRAELLDRGHQLARDPVDDRAARDDLRAFVERTLGETDAYLRRTEKP